MNRKLSQPIIYILILLCVSISTAAQKINTQKNDQSLVAPFIQKKRLTASDGNINNNFGQGVAIRGDVAVVGAPIKDNYLGAAYVYLRSGNNWIEHQRLPAGDLTTPSYFGNSVAIDGDTIVVGAYGNGTSGAVYVYVRSGNNWTLQQKLTPSDSPSRALFGRTIGISGNTIIAGAADADNLKGAAYIFVRSGTTWTQQQKIFTTEANTNRFGDSVAISGETVAIGESGDFNPQLGVLGAAYIFVRSGTTWIQQQKLFASDGQGGDYFGSSIAIEGDKVVVGSQSNTSVPIEKKGAAYVFVRSGTSWTQSQKLIANDGQSSDHFSSALAINGGKLVIGAWADAPLNNSNRYGSVYIFELTGNLWNQEQKLYLAENSTYYFGMSVAIDGERILVGAPGEVGNGQLQGAAYIFEPQGGNKPFDFDGDGRTDVSVYRPSEGIWYINRSQNGFYGVQWGISSDKLAPADFDGDGKTDVAIYRDGVWYILNSADNSVRILQFGIAEDIPIPADYDGDGKADINVYRPSSRVFYRLNSTDGQFFFRQFGTAGDQPFVANFDSDTRADIALYSPSSSTFSWINSTTGGTGTGSIGNPGDIPAAADYDGDGKTDIAVFRPSNGTWYRRNSSNSAIVSMAFGLTGDIPVEGDYDGDGKTDFAVFRPSNGFWYFLQSSNGAFYGYNFGNATDKPIPAAY